MPRSSSPKWLTTPKPIDDAVRWGFMHEAGPFEIWDMLGVKDTAKQMKAAGYAPAAWVKEMLKAGCETFYKYKGDNKVGVYDVANQKYVHIPRSPGLISA